jgi:hypothetical protein
MGQLQNAISSSIQTNGRERMRIDSNGNVNFPNWQDVLMNEMDKRKLTIKNPESLNTGNKSISGEWSIEYQGRDLSLNEDNYRWDIQNQATGVKGYYIIEREFINDSDWVYVRWGRMPVNVKERREAIEKKRLIDKMIIQRDMIVAVITQIPNR